MLYLDRRKETSTTSGSGSYLLNGASQGYKSFPSGQVYYCAATNTAYEVGIGTVSGGYLSRDSILDSTQNNEKLNWGVGTKTIFLTVPASWFSDIDSLSGPNLYKTGSGIFGQDVVVSGNLIVNREVNTGDFYCTDDASVDGSLDLNGTQSSSEFVIRRQRARFTDSSNTSRGAIEATSQGLFINSINGSNINVSGNAVFLQNIISNSSGIFGKEVIASGRGSSSSPAFSVGPTSEKMGMWSPSSYYLEFGLNGNTHMQFDSAFGTNFPAGPVRVYSNLFLGLAGQRQAKFNVANARLQMLHSDTDTGSKYLDVQMNGSAVRLPFGVEVGGNSDLNGAAGGGQVHLTPHGNVVAFSSGFFGKDVVTSGTITVGQNITPAYASLILKNGTFANFRDNVDSLYGQIGSYGGEFQVSALNGAQLKIDATNGGRITVTGGTISWGANGGLTLPNNLVAFSSGIFGKDVVVSGDAYFGTTGNIINNAGGHLNLLGGNGILAGTAFGTTFATTHQGATTVSTGWASANHFYANKNVFAIGSGIFNKDVVASGNIIANGNIYPGPYNANVYSRQSNGQYIITASDVRLYNTAGNGFIDLYAYAGNFTDAVKVGNGYFTTPSLTFANDTNTGFYLYSADMMMAVAGGKFVAQYDYGAGTNNCTDTATYLRTYNFQANGNITANSSGIFGKSVIVSGDVSVFGSNGVSIVGSNTYRLAVGGTALWITNTTTGQIPFGVHADNSVHIYNGGLFANGSALINGSITSSGDIYSSKVQLTSFAGHSIIRSFGGNSLTLADPSNNYFLSSAESIPTAGINAYASNLVATRNLIAYSSGIFGKTIVGSGGAIFYGVSYPNSYVAVDNNAYGFINTIAAPTLKVTSYDAGTVYGFGVRNDTSAYLGNSAGTAGVIFNHSDFNVLTNITLPASKIISWAGDGYLYQNGTKIWATGGSHTYYGTKGTGSHLFRIGDATTGTLVATIDASGKIYSNGLETTGGITASGFILASGSTCSVSWMAQDGGAGAAWYSPTAGNVRLYFNNVGNAPIQFSTNGDIFPTTTGGGSCGKAANRFVMYGTNGDFSNNVLIGSNLVANSSGIFGKDIVVSGELYLGDRTYPVLTNTGTGGYTSLKGSSNGGVLTLQNGLNPLSWGNHAIHSNTKVYTYDLSSTYLTTYNLVTSNHVIASGNVTAVSGIFTRDVIASGDLKVYGSQVNFSGLPTTDPHDYGRLYRFGSGIFMSLG